MGAERSVTEHGQATRDRILAATIDLVCRKGFSGTSVREVCEAVGVAKTAIYWHFGSKSGLMTAVIESVTVAWIDDFESVSRGEGTPQERIDGLMEAVQRLVIDRSELLRIMILTVMEQGTVDPHIVTKVRVLTDAIIVTIGEGFTKALGTELPDMDLLGHTIIALTHAALRRRIMDPDVDLDRLFKDFKRTVNVLVTDRIVRQGRKKRSKGRK
jgi:AcrR family transcriptional regulator